jgi:hypothetical protein
MPDHSSPQDSALRHGAEPPHASNESDQRQILSVLDAAMSTEQVPHRLATRPASVGAAVWRSALDGPVIKDAQFTLMEA